MKMPGRIRNRVALFVAVAMMPAAPAVAQRMLGAHGSAEEQRAIDEFESDFASRQAGLGCFVSPIKPVLNFAFRHQAGFTTVVPLEQLDHKGSVLTLRFRIHPHGQRKYYYFQHVYSFPDMPETQGFDAYLDDGLHLGEGSYDAAMVLKDQQGRICRANWKIRYKLKKEERKICQLKPGEVKPLTLFRWQSNDDFESRPFRVAVMLHAAPLSPGRVTLSEYDLSLLYSVLTTLFERTSFAPQSITAFNLQQQSEIFRTENVDARSLAGLLDKMEDLDLAKVDLKTLENHDGPAGLLSRMLDRVADSDDPPDAIVFVGPQSKCQDKNPAALFKRLRFAGLPPVFELNPSFELRLAACPDAVELLTRTLDGKILRFHDPKGLARALHEMEATLSQTASRKGRRSVRHAKVASTVSATSRPVPPEPAETAIESPDLQD
jgi:hypothetical protein